MTEKEKPIASIETAWGHWSNSRTSNQTNHRMDSNVNSSYHAPNTKCSTYCMQSKIYCKIIPHHRSIFTNAHFFHFNCCAFHLPCSSPDTLSEIVCLVLHSNEFLRTRIVSDLAGKFTSTMFKVSSLQNLSVIENAMNRKLQTLFQFWYLTNVFFWNIYRVILCDMLRQLIVYVKRYWHVLILIQIQSYKNISPKYLHYLHKRHFDLMKPIYHI